MVSGASCGFVLGSADCVLCSSDILGCAAKPALWCGTLWLDNAPLLADHELPDMMQPPGSAVKTFQ